MIYVTFLSLIVKLSLSSIGTSFINWQLWYLEWVLKMSEERESASYYTEDELEQHANWPARWTLCAALSSYDLNPSPLLNP